MTETENQENENSHNTQYGSASMTNTQSHNPHTHNNHTEHISKAKRKALKKEEKEKERDEFLRAKQKAIRNKKIKNYSILLLVILGISFFVYAKITPPENAPILSAETTIYNFGTVSQAKGTVDGIVALTNTGNQDLIITGLDSSCGCTSAAIIQNGQEGPKFSMSMHGTNPKGWSTKILPGESAQLKIYYDPNVHKDLRGSVTRIISIFSNDPMHSTTDVKVRVTQTD